MKSNEQERALVLAQKFGDLAVYILRNAWAEPEPSRTIRESWAREWSILAAHYARLQFGGKMSEHVPAYPPLPRLPAPTGPETAREKGLRILAFCLEHDYPEGLTDDELRLADHVYPLAIAGREVLPLAVDKLSTVRHRILGVIAWRARLEAERESLRHAGLRLGGIGPGSPEGARLQPGGPKPLSGGAFAVKPGDKVEVPF